MAVRRPYSLVKLTFDLYPLASITGVKACFSYTYLYDVFVTSGLFDLMSQTIVYCTRLIVSVI
jgi:hypothetical protein